jgi:DegV family protein with EDD domain
MSFEIMTDTSCNLPESLIERYQLKMVPLRYFLEGEEYISYVDGAAADFASFYAKLRQGVVVTTSLADGFEALQVARDILEGGSDILYLGFSSGLSGTCNAISSALSSLVSSYPERTVFCVDTLAASAGEGLVIDEVARLRATGAGIDECHAWAEENKLKVAHWFTVSDLMFLHRGGRLPRSVALIGTALSVNPIMHTDDAGTLQLVSMARGRRKSLLALADRFEQNATRPFACQRVFVSHGDCRDDAQFLADTLTRRFGVTDITITFVDPVIGAHSGPGTVALFFMANGRD